MAGRSPTPKTKNMTPVKVEEQGHFIVVTKAGKDFKARVNRKDYDKLMDERIPEVLNGLAGDIPPIVLVSIKESEGHVLTFNLMDVSIVRYYPLP